MCVLVCVHHVCVSVCASCADHRIDAHVLSTAEQMCACVHLCMCVCVHMCMCMYVCTCACVCVCKYACELAHSLARAESTQAKGIIFPYNLSLHYI